MQHLYSSLVKVTELKLVPKDGGRMRMERVPVEGLERMRCRLDLQFLRPGKDTPPAIVSGSIPDREGIMFCNNTTLLRAGMQVITIPDRAGKEVVKGVFEIKEIPDVALGFSSAHHIEVKVVESVQKEINYPDIADSIVSPPVPPVDDDTVAFPDVED